MKRRRAPPRRPDEARKFDVHPGKEETIVREDIGSTGFVQDASPVFAQRNDGRLRAALDEFESVLKIAIDDLFDAISDVLPDRYVELSDDDEDEDPLGAEVTVKGFHRRRRPGARDRGLRRLSTGR